MNSSKRRRFVKLIGVSGATSSAYLSEWSKPIVNSLILPAHAQTSNASQLIIAGFTVNCDDGVFENTVSYDVDDSLLPAALLESNDASRAIVITSELLVNTGDPDTDFETQILVSAMGVNVARPQLCPLGTAPEVQSNRLEFLTLSGNSWQAEFSLIVNGDLSISISNLILTPNL